MKGEKSGGRTSQNKDKVGRLQFAGVRDFWPFYVSQHLNPICRVLHVIGSFGVLILLALAIATKTWWLVLLTPVCGYSFAWIGHLVFEHNRPATFQYPLLSLACDWVLLFMMVTGRMQREIERSRAVMDYGGHQP